MASQNERHSTRATHKSKGSVGTDPSALLVYFCTLGKSKTTPYGQTELVATMRMQSWVQNSVQKSVHSSVHSPVPSPESRFYTNPGEHMLALWHASQGTIIESISLVLWIVCSSVMHSACHRCSYCWGIVCFVALKPFLLNLKHACCRHLYFCKVWNGY